MNLLRRSGGGRRRPVGFAALCAGANLPARPVRMIVPFGPGGNADVLARILAEKLSEQTGQRFYVEDIGGAGAGGNIGMGRAALAAPDGYTVLVAVPSYVTNPLVYDNAPYDAHKSFDPVTLAVSTTVMLAVYPGMPAQTINDLIALIKANPGKYNYATAGVGSPGHLLGEMLRQDLGQANRVLSDRYGRLRKVVEVAAERSGWGRQMPKGQGLGLAAHRSFVSYVSTVVEVAVDEKGHYSIPRIDTAIDCGYAVNQFR